MKMYRWFFRLFTVPFLWGAILSCSKTGDTIVDPVNISIISNPAIEMGWGTTASLDFRVNPSNATLNFDVTSSDCSIELDYWGENTKRGYVTTPTHIALSRIEQMRDKDNSIIVGQYRAYITDLRKKEAYDDRVGLVINVQKPDGAVVQISSPAITVSLHSGEISAFSFKASDNPRLLQTDVVCDIDGQRIYGRIPHLVDGKNLVPTIDYVGAGKLVLRSAPNQEVHFATDFSRPVVYDVVDEQTERVVQSYEVCITTFTGLPVVNIYTENDLPITSKEIYLNASVEIKDVVGEYDLPLSEVKIKGRGNSTWTMPKKPYALKFEKKTQLFGESNGKQWVLLANHSDKTSIRTNVAFYLGELSTLEWTPCSHFVELFINKQYQGLYELTEKIKIAKDRVNVSDDGFILEVDQLSRLDPDDVYFTTNRILLCIKDPDVEKDSDRYNWIKEFVCAAEEALYGDAFLDEKEGYKRYIDIDSFVDWYLINEITKNNDAVFFSSCYMNIAPGGKLKMGPLWDFDVSLGNINYNGCQTPEGFAIKESQWLSRMFEDPAFVMAVRSRFDYFNNHLDDIFAHINSEASLLRYSVIENNNKWGTFYNYTWPNYAIWGAYQNEVEYLKQFLSLRMRWLDDNLPK